MAPRWAARWARSRWTTSARRADDSPLLRQDRPATGCGAAVTGKAALRPGRVALVEHVRVVVGQLLARRDVADRLDPDAAVIDHGVAVRIARMVDEAGVVAVHRRVDYQVVVDREQERMMTLPLHVGVARVRLRRSEPFAGVLDQPHALGNVPDRE